MKGQDFILPFSGENILYGTLYKGLSQSHLFYDLIQPALLSSCQFLSAAANIGHNFVLQGLVKVIWKTCLRICFKTGIKLINFLMGCFLYPERHLLAEPVVFSICWGIPMIRFRNSTKDICHRWHAGFSSSVRIIDQHWFPFTHFCCKWCRCMSIHHPRRRFKPSFKTI